MMTGDGCVHSVQEKIDVLNERLEAANVAGGATKEDVADSLDSVQALKQSVKKCESAYTE